MDKVVVRSIEDMDLPFIFSSWLRSYKDQSSFARRIKKEVYYFWHHRIVETILSRANTDVFIAHVPDEPDVILGYLVKEKPNLAHYCFVKEPFRQMGIAKTLFKKAGLEKDFIITHFTYAIEPMFNKRGDIIYDPYRII